MELDLTEEGHFRDVWEIFARLDASYEETDLGNKDEPFEELVYIVLSTRTREEYYQRAFDDVASLVDGWDDLLKIDAEVIAEAIGSAGLANKKATALKQIARELYERRGTVSLDFLEDLPTNEAEEFLLSLTSVGHKVAKCVLMYSLERPVFPLDVHCRRVGNRIGWFSTESRYQTKRQLKAIERGIPPTLRKSLHVRLVQHGRMVCRPDAPRCVDCPIVMYCAYGQRMIPDL